MSSLKHAALSQDDAEGLILSVVRKRLDEFGLVESTLVEEPGFDGAPIFRVVATVERPVSAKAVISVTAEANGALWTRGDERFVILSTVLRDAPEDPPEEDLE